jgi:anti-anti-sigma factor
MSIQKWSENIAVVELSDDPLFTDEMNALNEAVEKHPVNVVLNFSGVSFINSSNLARLLRLRKSMSSSSRKLILCGVSSQVWGVFLVTGLDKIFEYTKDIMTALATMQLAAMPAKKG